MDTHNRNCYPHYYHPPPIYPACPAYDPYHPYPVYLPYYPYPTYPAYPHHCYPYPPVQCAGYAPVQGPVPYTLAPAHVPMATSVQISASADSPQEYRIMASQTQPQAHQGPISGRLLDTLEEHTAPKRPHSAIETLSDSDDYGYESDGPITETCDAIRRKINNLLNNGDMKVTEFQRACGINSNSFGRFMKLKGPYAGDSNQTYSAAFCFFKTREAAGIKKPTKKKVKKDEENKKLDVSSTTLDGEDDETVAVYDTCDDIRRKIAAYLREPNVTQAAFLRSLAQMLPDPTVRLQSKQLKDFQTKTGPLSGNTSRIYYTAYVFFEKQRIQQGKPKSKKRKENEDAWRAEGGIRRDRQMELFYCGPGMKPYMNEHGRVRVA